MVNRPVPVDFVGRANRTIGTSPMSAVKTGARRFTAVRLAASAEFPIMEEMRDRARAIRLHTLDNLADYLERFADRVERLGGTVAWAADAREANAYVARLANERGVGLAVKSKSMVTEEIELNDALEGAGVEVVETDLGEFIVQLGRDRPSHIIAPVMHKTRQDIGALFRDRLGVEYTEDPGELNAIARRYLRERFLSADMGISGVNFAVAETGSVCLVTNEGNGRLTTTAPRIHVALMGMERLVPTVGDLAVMLELLARSATGQRLSAYTNVITGPRRPGDLDGPEELHVVILDNGRSNVLSGNVSEVLACIRCGACLNICPVYREVGGHAYGGVYPGPIGSVLTPALDGFDAWHDLPHASSLCGACREACPVRIDLPELLLTLRRDTAAAGHASRWLHNAIRVYAAAATRPRAFRAMLRAGGLLGRAPRGPKGWIEVLPSIGRGWTAHRDLPRPARRSFHDQWTDRDGA